MLKSRLVLRGGIFVVHVCLLTALTYIFSVSTGAWLRHLVSCSAEEEIISQAVNH